MAKENALSADDKVEAWAQTRLQHWYVRHWFCGCSGMDDLRCLSFGRKTDFA